jgi:zinc ribbon protein
MDMIACPHCTAANLPDARFCEACGKALPEPLAGQPRIVDGSDVASTTAGKELQAATLQKQARRAAGALLVVAILQVAFGLLSLAEPEIVFGPGIEAPPAVYVTVFGIAAVFFGLFLWARKNPLPAAIVGLVLFLSLHLLEAVANPRSLAQGVIVKVIVIVILVKAIQAGVQYRKVEKASRI